MKEGLGVQHERGAKGTWGGVCLRDVTARHIQLGNVRTTFGNTFGASISHLGIMGLYSVSV